MANISKADMLNKVDNASDQFAGVITKTEKAIFDSAVALIKKLDIDSQGHIRITTANLKLLSDIKSRLGKLTKSKEYLKGVKELVKAFDDIYHAQVSYYSTQFAKKTLSDNAKKKFAAMQRIAVTNTIEGLTGSGVNANVTEELSKILLRAVTTGAKYSDLVDEFRSKLISSGDNISALAKYANTYATTALTQYAGQNNKLFTDDLGTEWFEYVGSQIETTRELCNTLLEHHPYIHQSEIKDILAGRITDQQTGEIIEIGMNPKTGLPKGMIEGTTPDNFQVNVGGWNCRHQLVPIAKEAVPENIRAKYDKATQQKIAQQKAEEEKQKKIAELKGKLAKYANWKDADKDGINEALNNGDIPSLEAQIANMKAIENALAKLDLLVNPKSSLEHFSIAELQSVQDAVAKTINDWLKKYNYSDILSNPTHAVAKLEQEIKNLQQYKKYPTWQVAQKAYQKQLDVAQKEVIKATLIGDLQSLKSFKTKSPIYKNLLNDLDNAINNGDLDGAQKIKAKVIAKQQELLASGNTEAKQIKDVVKHNPQSTNDTPQSGHIADYQMHGSEAIEAIKKVTGITDDKIAQRYLEAVVGFSFQWDFEIRSVQCGNSVTSKHGHTLDAIIKRAKDIEEFIAKSPQWNGGTTYRGMSLSPEELKNLRIELQAGKGDMQGCASWSTKEHIARSFSGYHIGELSPKFGDRKTERVVLVANRHKKATSIMHLSTFTHEYEVLATKQCRYRFVSERKDGQYTIFDVEPSN